MTSYTPKSELESRIRKLQAHLATGDLESLTLLEENIVIV
jgi:hypothetical protein